MLSSLVQKHAKFTPLNENLVSVLWFRAAPAVIFHPQTPKYGE